VAWAFVAERGTAADKTTAVSMSMSPSASIPAGAILVVRCAADNELASADGETTQHAVTDSKGNTYTRLVEFSRNAGAKRGGVVKSLFISKLQTGLTTSDTITFDTGWTADGSAIAKAMALAEFSVGAGKTWQRDGKAAAGGSSTTPSVTISGLSSIERLWLGGVGIEATTADGFTEDADYASLTAVGTSGGSAATNVADRTARRIATLTADTYNPTLGTARDWAAVLVALAEVNDITPVFGQAILVADAVLRGAAGAVIRGATVLHAEAVLTAAARAMRQAQATLVADAVLTAAGVGVRFSRGALHGEAVLLANGRAARLARAALHGDAVLAATARALLGAAGLLQADAVLRADGRGAFTGQALLTGDAVLAGNGRLAAAGHVLLDGEAVLQATPRAARSAAAVLAADAVLEAAARAALRGAGVLDAEALVRATATAVRGGQVLLGAEAVLLAVPVRILRGGATLDGDAVLIASGTLLSGGGGQVLFGHGHLVGDAGLQAVGLRVARVGVRLEGDVVLVAAPTRLRAGGAQLHAEALVSSMPGVVRSSQGVLLGEAVLTARKHRLRLRLPASRGVLSARSRMRVMRREKVGG
jgi:hypothetical protein